MQPSNSILFYSLIKQQFVFLHCVITREENYSVISIHDAAFTGAMDFRAVFEQCNRLDR